MKDLARDDCVQKWLLSPIVVTIRRHHTTLYVYDQ